VICSMSLREARPAGFLHELTRIPGVSESVNPPPKGGQPRTVQLSSTTTTLRSMGDLQFDMFIRVCLMVPTAREDNSDFIER